MLEEIIKNTTKKYIIGVDEVGVGCIAGPTYVCAVKAPKDWILKGIRDSKKLTEKKRESFAKILNSLNDEGVISYKPAIASSFELDREGIYNSIHRLYNQVITEIDPTDSLIIIDGKKFKEERYEYIALVGGDDLVPHISSASVLAKVGRDSYMTIMHDLHPMYNWKSNKGYGSKEHLDALKKYGVSPLHRRSYEPIKSMVAIQE